MKRTLKFIFSLLGLVGTAHAQSVPTPGLRLGVDVVAPTQQLVNERLVAYEGLAEGIFRRWHVVAEGGYGRYAHSLSNYDYRATGGYGRLGAEFNVLQDSDALVGFGARVAHARFDERFSAIRIPNNFWGEALVSRPDRSPHAWWGEATASVKVRAIGSFYVGFTARFKVLIDLAGAEEVSPYRIPGFGDGSANTQAGLSYWLMYKIPFRR